MPGLVITAPNGQNKPQISHCKFWRSKQDARTAVSRVLQARVQRQNVRLGNFFVVELLKT